MTLLGGRRTKLVNVHVGDEVEAGLLGYDASVKGTIESITGGISAANAANSTQGLPNVDPIFTWVRLAKRIPVRIRISHVPQGVPLIAGMTCNVSVVGAKPAAAPNPPLAEAGLYVCILVSLMAYWL